MKRLNDVSRAVYDAAKELSKKGGATYIDIAKRAQVSFEAAQWSTKNMARSGRLCVVERRSVDGIAKPLNVYKSACEVRQLNLLF